MKVNLLLFVLLTTKLFSQGKVDSILAINSNNDIKLEDTAFVFAYVDIQEFDTLYSNLDLLDRFHFKKLYYQGHIRKRFPTYKRHVKELQKVNIVGKNLEDIPSFVFKN